MEIGEIFFLTLSEIFIILGAFGFTFFLESKSWQILELSALALCLAILIRVIVYWDKMRYEQLMLVSPPKK